VATTVVVVVVVGLDQHQQVIIIEILIMPAYGEVESMSWSSYLIYTNIVRIAMDEALCLSSRFLLLLFFLLLYYL